MLARGALVGRRLPPLVALSSLTSAVGRRRPPFVASSSSTLAASATVVVGWRRPPLASSSLSTPASSVTVVGQRRLLEGLGLTSAPDGRDCLRAFDGCLSAPRLLARGSVRGVLPRSTARDPVRGLVVIDVSRVGDGRGRGGTAAPAARDLIVVDAGVVRLLLEGLGLTSAFDGHVCLRAVDGRLSTPRLLARGSVRGVLPRSTTRRPVRGLVVIEAGRVGDGRGRGGMAAPAACDLVVVDAGRVGDGRGTRRSQPRRRQRRRRPPPP